MTEKRATWETPKCTISFDDPVDYDYALETAEYALHGATKSVEGSKWVINCKFVDTKTKAAQ